MRLDLRSDYEQSEKILEILSLITLPAFDAFECKMIATKVPKLPKHPERTASGESCGFASERKSALEKMGFIASEEKLIGGHDRKIYTDYYILQK